MAHVNESTALSGTSLNGNYYGHRLALSLKKITDGTAFSFCLVAVVAGAAAGCGGNDNPLGRQPIRGTVALDGNPLESGSIRFEPLDGKAMTGSYIKDGAFELPEEKGLPAGTYKVSISSPWRDPSLPPLSPGDPGPPPIERVAPQFNIKSTLKVKILDGRNDLTFEVRSAPKG